MEFNGSNHLILKEDDIVGILETDEIKDLQPLNDRVLIKVSPHALSMEILLQVFKHSHFLQPLDDVRLLTM